MSLPKDPLNVLIVGEIGVGKSSIVNLIARKSLVQDSPDSMVCTKKTTDYDMPANSEIPLNVWEVAGFNQPRDGNSPTEKDVSALDVDLGTILARDRAAVDIVLFCIRGERVRVITTKVFDFVRELFEGQVPIVLVINHLENEKVMEEWWARNKEGLRERGIIGTEHVCVTGRPGYSKYEQSHKALLKILRTNYATRRTKSLESIFIEYVRRNLNQRRKLAVKTLVKRYKLDKRTAKQLVDSVFPPKQRRWYSKLKLW